MTVDGAPALRLGAPGVYRVPLRAPFALRPERLDVAGFVGVAPRGPVDAPVPVTSWAEYQARFGGAAGPGRLGSAVRAFFAQGGARAQILRVSPLPRAPAAVALDARSRHRLDLSRDVWVTARDEGTWGDRLSLQCTFDAVERFAAVVRGNAVQLPDATALPVGSLVRIRGLLGAGAFRWVDGLAVRDFEPGRRVREATLVPGPALADAVGEAVEVEVEVVTATLAVTDDDPALPRGERFAGLGLVPGHPRFVADVLRAESLLVTPGDGWDEPLVPDLLLTAVTSTRDRDGVDRYAAIGRGSFIGDEPAGLLPVDGIPDDPDAPDDPDTPQVYGADRMAMVPEIGLFAVPDLLWSYVEPGPLTAVASRPKRPAFVRCAAPPVPATAAVAPVSGLLDSGTELAEILRRQGRLVELADRQRRFVALLDVPPSLPVRAITRWRSSFDSSFAAAYHPWLGVVDPDDPLRRAVTVPPTAFAAGIIAERELRLGLPWGPANELATGAVTAADPVSDADHDVLHLAGIDVFRAERDGFRLTAARTLSTDPDYRQLSVRRLMTMLALVLHRQTQRLVFEPHTPALREVLHGVLTALLRELFEAAAFAGANEDEAFYVHCDDALNPLSSQALGRLVAEVGVSPAQPLEYLVLRITQDADGAVAVAG